MTLVSSNHCVCERDRERGVYVIKTNKLFWDLGQEIKRHHLICSNSLCTLCVCVAMLWYAHCPRSISRQKGKGFQISEKRIKDTAGSRPVRVKYIHQQHGLCCLVGCLWKHPAWDRGHFACHVAGDNMRVAVGRLINPRPVVFFGFVSTEPVCTVQLIWQSWGKSLHSE